MILLDTNIVSEVMKASPADNVLAWLNEQSSQRILRNPDAGGDRHSIPWDSSSAMRRSFSTFSLLSSSGPFGIEPVIHPQIRHACELPRVRRHDCEIHSTRMCRDQ